MQPPGPSNSRHHRSLLARWERAHERAAQVGVFALLLLVCGVGQALAQDPDFADLSLDQLLDLDVLSINALGTHTHLAGEWMIGYRFMGMGMEGNQIGTLEMSEDAVLEDFMVTPTDMTTQMHMLEVMYAPSNALTLMVMLPYHRRFMNHVTRADMRFATESSGIGDLVLEGLYTFVGDVMKDDHRLLFNAGLSVPTGSIERSGDTPAAEDQHLPYPMQFGSGTVDLRPGLTYLGESRSLAWMLQTRGVVRLGSNSRDYTLGDRFQATAWTAWAWTEWLSPSLQVDGAIWGNVEGADPELNPMMVPTADPTRRGGRRVDLAPGFLLYAPRGKLEGQRIAVQLSIPVYQSLDGPQLGQDWMLTVGWSWTY